MTLIAAALTLWALAAIGSAAYDWRHDGFSRYTAALGLLGVSLLTATTLYLTGVTA